MGDQPDPDGLFGLFSGNFTSTHGGGVYNNTFISTAGSGVGVCFSANSDVSGMTFENNAVSGCNQLMETDSIPFAPDHNQYADGGNNAFVCRGNYYKSSEFSSWQSCIAGDSHSSYRSSLKVDSTYQPQSGSPLINAGTSLTPLCSGSLSLPVLGFRRKSAPIGQRVDRGRRVDFRFRPRASPGLTGTIVIK